MTNETLDRLRKGLKAKRFTLTDAANASDIPIMTLADMAKEGWGKRALQVIDRLEALDAALNDLEGGAQ
jgi:hypothetical protein